MKMLGRGFLVSLIRNNVTRIDFYYLPFRYSSLNLQKTL